MAQLDIPLSFIGPTEAAAHARLSDIARLGTWSELLEEDVVDDRALWWIDAGGVHVIFRVVT